jgi:hypothetical protein
MRFPIFALTTLLLPFKAWSACPDLALVKTTLPEIHDRLKSNSDKPVRLNKDFIVRDGEPSSATDDLLISNLEGYTMDRLKEKMPGVCHYQLRDDKASVRARFILYHQ